MPYDCCSYQGQRDVSLDTLSIVFRPLDELVQYAEVRFRTLSKCNWDSAGVAVLANFCVDCCVFQEMTVNV